MPDAVLTIQSTRRHAGKLAVQFAEAETREAVEAFAGSVLYARSADLPPLSAGTYRDADLIGLRVIDERLGDLGRVRSVAHYPQADMLVVGERALLVPMLAAYGVVIDIPAATIGTRLPEGFEEL
jgi:16S rRNA processing protein RimM